MGVNSPLGYEMIQGCLSKVMVRNAECALFSGTCLAALVLKLERQKGQFLQKYGENTGWRGGQQAKITWNHPEKSFQEMTHNLFEELGANLPPREPLPSLKEHSLRKTAPKSPSFIALGARLARAGCSQKRSMKPSHWPPLTQFLTRCLLSDTLHSSLRNSHAFPETRDTGL